jgi:hypothetical protein
MPSAEELLQEARWLDLSRPEGRFRLGDLAEALRRELPAAADLLDRLAIEREVERHTLTESWFVAARFRRPPAVPTCRGPDTSSYGSTRAPRAGRPRRIGGLGSGSDRAGTVGSHCRPTHLPDQSA